MRTEPVSDLREQLRRAGFRITAEDARTLARELEEPPPRPAVNLGEVSSSELLEDAEWMEQRAEISEMEEPKRSVRLRHAAVALRVYVAERIAQREGGAE
jgi:hypothetical protein